MNALKDSEWDAIASQKKIYFEQGHALAHLEFEELKITIFHNHNYTCK